MELETPDEDDGACEACNLSHLEAVDPVVVGSTAREGRRHVQQRVRQNSSDSHPWRCFGCGQGIVCEVLKM